jgi:hypothetical protein
MEIFDPSTPKILLRDHTQAQKMTCLDKLSEKKAALFKGQQ